MTALALSGTPAPTWRTVVARGFRTLAIRSDGTLSAWGLNLNGQLGLGTSAGPYRMVPTQVGTAKDWLAIAAGESHSLALGGTATVQSIFVAGQTTAGRLGVGNTVTRSVPTKLTATATLKAPWTALAACRRSYGVALQSDGLLFSWGDDSDGQLGQAGSATPLVPTVAVLSGKRVIAVAAGEAHVLAIADDGTLLSWGNNAAGQLGLGGTTTLTQPTQVGTDTDLVFGVGRQQPQPGHQTRPHVVVLGCQHARPIGRRQHHRFVGPHPGGHQHHVGCGGRRALALPGH